jgi:hypothetical protein
MRIDVQITLSLDRKVDHAVPRDLVQHVVKEADAGRKFCNTRAVKVNGDADLRFKGVAGYFSLPHGSRDQARDEGPHDTIGLVQRALRRPANHPT